MEITQEFQFDSGHRLLRHEGKCRHLHGHRYRALVSISPVHEKLDAMGMVLDFSKIKELIGAWIDGNWDHNTLLHPDDPLRSPLGTDPCRTDKPVYVMPHDTNPTVENMVQILFGVCVHILEEANDLPVLVERIALYETPKCSAEYTRDEFKKDGG